MTVGARRLVLIGGIGLMGGALIWLLVGLDVFGRRDSGKVVNPEDAPLQPLHYRIIIPRTVGHETDVEVFGYIADLATDAQGYIYVADTKRHRIVKFDSAGNFVQQIGRPGQGPGELLYPVGVDIDDEGFVYVLDAGNSRVQVYTPDGRYHDGFRFEPTLPGGTYGPIAVGKAGEVFLNLPRTGYLVSVFSREGRKLRDFGELEPYPSLGEVLIFNNVILRLDRGAGVLHVVFPKLCMYRGYSADGRLLFSKRVFSSWMRSKYESLSRQHRKRSKGGDRSVRWVEFLRSACVLPDHSLLVTVSINPDARHLCQFSREGNLQRRFFLAPASADTVSLDCLAAFRGSSIRIAFADLFRGLVGIMEERR